MNWIGEGTWCLEGERGVSRRSEMGLGSGLGCVVGMSSILMETT